MSNSSAFIELNLLFPGASPRDIAQVLVRSAFPKNLQFSKDDILDGRKPDGLALKIKFPSILHGPSMELILPRRVDVGLEARLVMDEVEMASIRPKGLQLNDLDGGQVNSSTGNASTILDASGRLNSDTRSMSWVSRGSP